MLKLFYLKKIFYATVFIGSLLLTTFSAWANSVESIKITPSKDKTTIVLNMTQEPTFSYFDLTKPDRLVVDIRDSTIKAELPMNAQANPHLKTIRLSSPAYPKSQRLVLELTSALEAELTKTSKKVDGSYQLIIDLKGKGVEVSKDTSLNTTSEKTVEPQSTASKTTTTPISTPAAPKPIPTISTQRVGKVVVAIDAGHGGQDPGSIGPTKKYEKQINLDIAKKVVQRLNRTSNIRGILTRDKDIFLDLNARSEIARKNNAMLLLSIHADSYSTSGPRGASAFVLSTRRANTEIARWIEKKEEQSQLLGGGGSVLSAANDKNVKQTVLDLQFSYSQTEGNKLAIHILKELGKVTKLHSSKPIYASLAVLKSPDIPSILVETGFISNPAEEKLLTTAHHQNKIADAIAKAIQGYFRDNPPEGTITVNHNGDQIHTVRNGEALSIIAQRYGTTTKNLMDMNNLKNANIRVGQKLRVGAKPTPAQAISQPQAVSQAQREAVTYKVKSGDYLGKIAEQHGVSISSIKSANNLSSNTVRVGQTLTIPNAK